MTIANDLMEEVVARLAAPSVSAFYPLPINVRRNHRVNVTRNQCPAIHVIDGDEDVVGRKSNDCDVNVSQEFTVSIFVRDDAGFVESDPIKVEVMARLENVGTSPVYPWNARIEPGNIRVDQEIADADSLRVDMKFTFRYERPKWSL